MTPGRWDVIRHADIASIPLVAQRQLFFHVSVERKKKRKERKEREKRGCRIDLCMLVKLYKVLFTFNFPRGGTQNVLLAL